MGLFDDFKEEMKKSYEEGKEEGRRKGTFEYQLEKTDQRREKKRLEKQEHKEKMAQIKKDNKYRKKQMKIEGTAYCPKCKGTSIQYVERRKQLSIGRGIVGSFISPLGGAVGAVTSKKYKGFVKCLNCGYKWKK